MALTPGISSAGLQTLAGSGTEECYSKGSTVDGSSVEIFEVGVDSGAASGVQFWINGQTARKVYVAPGQKTVIKDYKGIHDLDCTGAAVQVYWNPILVTG